MRILIFSPQFEKGALEKLDRDLATYLKKLGAYVITVNMYIKSNKGIDKKNENAKYYLNLPINPSPFNLLLGIIKLRLIILREKIDIIETSSESLSILTIFACLGTKTSHVIGIHKTYNRKVGSRGKIREVILLILTKFRKKTYFYAVSNWAKKAWINFSNTKEDRIKVIFNSINFSNNLIKTDQVKKNLYKELNIPIGGKLILCVGRICSHKRQDFIIRCLGSILKKENLYLLFIGDRDLEHKDSIKTLNNIKFFIKKYHIESNVKFTGYRNDIKEIMSISDLLVHSTITEAFGLILIEAMSTGLPIVASKVEAIPEFIREPDNYLVEYYDVKGFEKSVKEVLNRDYKKKNEVFQRNIRIGKSKKFSRLERANKMYEYFQTILKE